MMGEGRGAKVRCVECARFRKGQGSVHALGVCRGEPWDGHAGQWPFAAHRCKGFQRREDEHDEGSHRHDG